MNTTTDTSTSTSTSINTSTDTETSSHSRRRRPAAKRLLVALAGASLLVGGGALTANAQTDDAPVRCEASGTGSADSLERTADACELRYVECMRNAPGTADSLERWADHCYGDATA
ncbi:MAG: hypothetical protein AB8G14_06100 [Ilumatobacter sp.]